MGLTAGCWFAPGRSRVWHGPHLLGAGTGQTMSFRSSSHLPSYYIVSAGVGTRSEGRRRAAASIFWLCLHGHVDRGCSRRRGGCRGPRPATQPFSLLGAHRAGQLRPTARGRLTGAPPPLYPLSLLRVPTLHSQRLRKLPRSADLELLARSPSLDLTNCQRR